MIPMIKYIRTGRQAVRLEEKADLLRETFFPELLEVDLRDIESVEYLD